MNNVTSPFPERSIRTYEDWKAFVAKPGAVRPPMLTRAEYDQSTKAEKKEFNQVRSFYNNSFGPVLVPAMDEILSSGLAKAHANRSAPPGARPGIILDGDSTVGKSTIAMQLGRQYELLVTKKHTITHTPTRDVFIPVAYVNLPAEMAILDFNILLAKFYNIPYAARARSNELTDQIKAHAAACSTSMFILDDIHFLQMKNRTHAMLNNHIKHLANSISATFVYAGIDLERTGLLTEGQSVERGANTQTARRFSKFNLSAYSAADPISEKNYEQLLNFIDANILLLDQLPGNLYNEFGGYIMDRTSGYIGPIMDLLRSGATISIRSGQEKFNRKDLEKVRLDYTSETAYKLTLKRKAASTQRSAASRFVSYRGLPRRCLECPSRHTSRSSLPRTRCR